MTKEGIFTESGEVEQSEWEKAQNKWMPLENELARARAEIEQLMRTDYAHGKYVEAERERDQWKAMCERMAEAWRKHQSTKFKSDGSHFQADIEMNALMTEFEWLANGGV